MDILIPVNSIRSICDELSNHTYVLVLGGGVGIQGENTSLNIIHCKW